MFHQHNYRKTWKTWKKSLKVDGSVFTAVTFPWEAQKEKAKENGQLTGCSENITIPFIFKGIHSFPKILYEYTLQCKHSIILSISLTPCTIKLKSFQQPLKEKNELNTRQNIAIPLYMLYIPFYLCIFIFTEMRRIRRRRRRA